MIKAGDKIRFKANHADPLSVVRSGVVSKVLKDDYGFAYLARVAKGKVVIVLDTQVVD